MKKLIIIRGPLGVGKTTVSKLLSDKLHLTYLSLDDILDDNHLIPPNADGVPLDSYLQANAIILDFALQHDTSIILDGCFYYPEQIDDLVTKFDGNISIVTLTSTVETCIDRDRNRDKTYGEDAARFVHTITTNVKAGYEIDNTDLTPEQTVDMILDVL